MARFRGGLRFLKDTAGVDAGLPIGGVDVVSFLMTAAAPGRMPNAATIRPGWWLLV